MRLLLVQFFKNAYASIFAGIFLFVSSLYIYYQRGSLSDMIIILCMVGLIGILVTLLAHAARIGAPEMPREYHASIMAIVCFFSLLAWCVIVLLLLLYNKIPLSQVSLYTSTFRYVLTIIVTYGLFTVIAVAIGRLVLSPCFYTNLYESASSFLRAFVAGLFVITLFFYAAALIGALNIASLLICVCMGLLAIWLYRREFVILLVKHRIRITLFSSSGGVFQLHSILGVLVCIYALFVFVNVAGFFPLNGDDLRAYYNIPKTYVQHNSIIDFPYDASNNGAIASAFIYAPLIMIGDYLLNYISLYFFIFSIIATYALGRKMHSDSAGQWAAFFIFTMPLAFWFMLSAKIDYLVVAIVTIACISFVNWLHDGSTKNIALGAFLVGFAAAIKYTALLFIPAFFVALLAWSIVEKKFTYATIRAAIICGIFFTLGFAPWGIRNSIVHGSPLYPYGLSGVYKTQNIITDADRSLVRDFYSPAWDAGHVFNPERPWYYNVMVFLSGKSGYLANRIGPVFIGLLPLVGIAYQLFRKRSHYIWATVLLGTILVLWFTVVHLQVWYILYIFPLWAVLIGAGLTALRTRWFGFLILIMLIVTAGIHVSFSRGHLLPFYAGMLSYDQYISAFGPGVELNRYLNTSIRQANPNYLVFPMGQQRQILLDDNYKHLYGDNVFLNAWAPLALSQRSDYEIDEWMRSKGITHSYIIYEDIDVWRRIWCEYSSVIAETCPKFDRVMSRYYAIMENWRLVHSGDGWSLYER